MRIRDTIVAAGLLSMTAAVLSSRVIEEDVAAGHLHGLRITGLPLKRDMYLLWDRRRVLPIPARLFCDFL